MNSHINFIKQTHQYNSKNYQHNNIWQQKTENMNIVKPCFEKCLDLFMQNKEIKKNEIIKKYKTVDITPPIQDNTSVNQFEQSMPKSFVSLKGAQIFIVPSIEDEANNDRNNNQGNLQIEKCQNSSFIILRSLQNVYMDNCNNCTAFIGPCYSTLFIRNCKNIKIRALSQQLRVQNSSTISIQAIVGVKPVLQDCKKIKFSSLACRMYEDLVWQIQSTKINLFDNQIYQCYDFTPKKVPNFVNIQSNNSSESSNNSTEQSGQLKIQKEWQSKIEENELDWGFKNVYIPQFTSVKKSMLLKIYNQNQIKNNSNIFITYTKMHLKQFLNALSCPQLVKNFLIIHKLKEQACIKVLKTYSNYKQKINNLSKRNGQWFFLMVKINKNINKSGIGLGFIQQKDIVWRLFEGQLSHKQ